MIEQESINSDRVSSQVALEAAEFFAAAIAAVQRTCTSVERLASTELPTISFQARSIRATSPNLAALPGYSSITNQTMRASMWLKCSEADILNRTCDARFAEEDLSTSARAHVALLSHTDSVLRSHSGAQFPRPLRGVWTIVMAATGVTSQFPADSNAPSARLGGTSPGCDASDSPVLRDTAPREARCHTWYASTIARGSATVSLPAPVERDGRATGDLLVRVSTPLHGPQSAASTGTADSEVVGACMADVVVTPVAEATTRRIFTSGYGFVARRDGLVQFHPLVRWVNLHTLVADDAAVQEASRISLGDVECNRTESLASLPAVSVSPPGVFSLIPRPPDTPSSAGPCRSVIMAALASGTSGSALIRKLRPASPGTLSVAAAPVATSNTAQGRRRLSHSPILDPAALREEQGAAAAVEEDVHFLSWEPINGTDLVLFETVPQRDAVNAFAPAEQAIAVVTALVLASTAGAAAALVIITVGVSVVVAFAISVPMVSLRNTVVRVANRRVAGDVPPFRAVTLEMAQLVTIMAGLYSEVNAANTAASKGQPRSALDKLARVAVLFDRLDNSRGQGVCRNNRGAINLALGNVNEAVGDLRAAVHQAAEDSAGFFARLALARLPSGSPALASEPAAGAPGSLRRGSNCHARRPGASSATPLDPQASRADVAPHSARAVRLWHRVGEGAAPSEETGSASDMGATPRVGAPRWSLLSRQERLDAYSLALQEARRRENLGRALLTLGRRQDLAEAARCLEEGHAIVVWMLSVDAQPELDSAKPPPPQQSARALERDGHNSEGDTASSGVLVEANNGGEAQTSPAAAAKALRRFRRQRVRSSILLGRLRLSCLVVRASARSVEAARQAGDRAVAAKALLAARRALSSARQALVDAVDAVSPALLRVRVPSVWGSLEPPECAALRFAVARASVLRAMEKPSEAARVLEMAIITAPIAIPAVAFDAAQELATILRQDLRCFAASAGVSNVPRVRDVLFLIDRSGSMAGGLSTRSLALVKHVATEEVTPSDRVALFTFAEGIQCDLALTMRGTAGSGTGLDSLLTAIDHLPLPSGSSSCFEALDTVVELVANGFASSGHRSPHKRQPVIVVVTDGADTRGRTGAGVRLQALERAARERNLPVIVGLLGGAEKHAELEVVARTSRLGAFLPSPTGPALARAVSLATGDTHGPDTLLEAY